MLTDVFDQVAEEIDAEYGADDSQSSVIYGNKWFNALPSLKFEVPVGLPNSYSDLWVNIPSAAPLSAEDVELRQRGYALLTDPEYSRRRDEFLKGLKAMRKEHEEDETKAA